MPPPRSAWFPPFGVNGAGPTNDWESVTRAAAPPNAFRLSIPAPLLVRARLPVRRRRVATTRAVKPPSEKLKMPPPPLKGESLATARAVLEAMVELSIVKVASWNTESFQMPPPPPDVLWSTLEAGSDTVA